MYTYQPFVSAQSTQASDPPAYLEQHEQARLKAAAARARNLFPGPVGEFIYRELTGWGSCGMRFDQDGVTSRAIAAIMNAPLPEPPDSAQA
jgi:hypothetical protein